MNNAANQTAKSVPDINPGEENKVELDRLIQILQREAAETAGWTGRKRFSDPVIDAIRRVPRHAFFPERPSMFEAYANRPYPIGFGQTISQPYIVALMTELADLTPTARVLEVGTGSGYQAAVLAELAQDVFTIERIEELAQHAKRVFKTLGYANIHVAHDDGSKGWAEHAPYDVIVVTAAAQKIPKALIDQLAPGGRMIIPIGGQWDPQSLTLGIKDQAGKFTKVPLLPVAFVPLVCTNA